MATGKLDITTEAEWKTEVEESPVPVVIDFHAEWCPPCKTLGPLIKGWVAKVEGKVKLIKIDVDQAPELSSKCEIAAMPTVFLYIGGVQKKKIVGLDKGAIEGMINEAAKQFA